MTQSRTNDDGRQANETQLLVDVDDSVLIIIDVQETFLNKYDRAKTQSLVSKTAWLIDAAGHLGVPIVAMAEDIGNNGTLVDEIRNSLPYEIEVHDKDFFGLTGNPKIMSALEATGRKTAICVGMETDVCVAQTALGLLSEGYEVVTLEDAIITTEWDEHIGINRMRAAGVVISSVKALFYEWTRSVSVCRHLDQVAPELQAKRPPTLVL
jgi:nicotinamidase-related amidase